jgi:hypothetical protein
MAFWCVLNTYVYQVTCAHELPESSGSIWWPQAVQRGCVYFFGASTFQDSLRKLCQSCVRGPRDQRVSTRSKSYPLHTNGHFNSSAIIIELHSFRKIISVPTNATAFANRGEWYNLNYSVHWKDVRHDEYVSSYGKDIILTAISLIGYHSFAHGRATRSTSSMLTNGRMVRKTLKTVWYAISDA